MRKVFLLGVVVFAVLSLPAQNNALRPLSIGDTLTRWMPDLIPGFDEEQTNRKKLYLLDFWNKRCGSCIAAFPKLEALQNSFEEEVQVILITRETQDVAEAIFRKIKNGRPQLPMLFGDTLFSKLFPHEAEPFHVWVDGNFVVRHLTDGHNAGKEQVARFVKGESLRLSHRTYLDSFDQSQPLLFEGKRLFKQVSGYSLFMRGLHNQTLGNFLSVPHLGSDSSYSVRAINRSILTLFSLAYNKELYGKRTLIFDPAKDNRILAPPFLFPPPDSTNLDRWKEENLVSYEMSLPGVSEDNFYREFQEDLDRYLPYRASVQLRKIKVYVVRRMDIQTPLETSKGMEGFTEAALKRTTTERLVVSLTYLNHLFTKPVCLDKGVDGLIRLYIPKTLSSLEDLRKVLRMQGYDITEEEHEMKVLVVRTKQ